MLRGERFEVDLGQDDEDAEASTQTAVLPGAFVNDILERKTAAPKPPTAPTLKSNTGFPEHGMRKAESRFKQRQNGKSGEKGAPRPSATSQDASFGQPATGGKARTWEEEEKARIDRENNDRLAEMSSAEIEQERQELLNSLGPEMIQKLLQRSNIDSGGAETDLSKPNEPLPGSSLKRNNADGERREKKVAFAAEDVDDHAAAAAEPELEDDDPTDSAPPAASLPAEDSIHFPHPTQPPELDPSSDSFLSDLHTKYFPSLPADPDKLEWMQAKSNPKTNTYDPSASGLEPKDIRFSFKGALIPPSTAAAIPVTAGLHHHGDAPDAAGYTIAELSHLSHSSYAAQRCIAFQTLGRILYRLGTGEYGDAGEPTEVEGGMGPLARGLWREVNQEKVTEMLVRESEGKGVDGGRHLSAKAYATEAVWLWQKGGGRRLGAE